MNRNNPDTYLGESEEKYTAQTNEEVESSTGLMFMFVAIFIFIINWPSLLNVHLLQIYLVPKNIERRY